MDEEKIDLVNHPPHYMACRIVWEPVDATELLPHPLASAVEYILRSPYKGSEKQDLEKAVWWLMRFRDETMPRLHCYDGVYRMGETAGVHLWVFCQEHPLLRGLCKLRSEGYVVEADAITNVAKGINARISRLSSQEVPHV